MKELNWVGGEDVHDLTYELSCGEEDMPLAVISPDDYEKGTFDGVVIIRIKECESMDAAKLDALVILKRAGVVKEENGKIFRVIP